MSQRALMVLCGLLLGAARPAAAQSAAAMVAAQSEIVFTSRQMGVPVEGRFKRFEAHITLDPKRPELGSVVIDVDTASASLGLAEADAELAGPAWFDAARFGKASFRSSAIRQVGGGRFEVSGRLTIKTSTNDLVIPVAVTEAAGTSTATGSVGIRRLDYGIGQAEWADTAIVADEVQIRFRLVLTGIPAL